MTEIELSRELIDSLHTKEFEKQCNQVENGTEFKNISEISEISSRDNLLENSVDVPTPMESLQTTKSAEESDNLKTEDSISDSRDRESIISKDDKLEDEWLDILGNGNFKKKVIKPGLGHETRPHRGDKVIADIVLFVNGTVFEENYDLTFIAGDMDVLQGIDLVTCLMEKGEKAKVIIPSQLAYGNKGRLPEVPPDTAIECDIEIKEVETIDPDDYTLGERLKFGDQKRQRGNYFYERAEYIEAIHCYEKAAEYLDGIRDCSGASTELSQEIVDMKIKVYNNMAASHLKLSAYSAALKSVELVLKVQPKNVKALYRKAKILGAQGSTEEAILCLRLAANLEPDTKIIQVELSKFQDKKKREDQTQKAMYQRMFPQKPQKKSSFTKAIKWSMFAGSVLAVAVGLAAYRLNHS